ncbi:hypothetical protein BJX65DRAFT_298160 [Aspergillus insuetus]
MSEPRKLHKKSRYGCDNCRRRRVKRDELGPPCTNCILRQISDCTYSQILPASLIAQAQTRACACQTGHEAFAQVELPSGAPLEAASAIDELELMHHFATETYQTLCVSKSEHIATTREGSEARMYIDAGLSYHSISLEPFRIAIGNLTPENCEAAFAQSIVTTAISLALPQLTAHKAAPAPASEPTSSTRMTGHILTIFKLLQGVKRILTLKKQHITLQLFTQGPFWRKDVSTTLDTSTIVAFEGLTRLNQLESVNAIVITYLRHCFMKFACAPQADPAPVLAWLGAVDVEFVESLRRQERVPLLVLALVDEVLGSLEGQGVSTSREWEEYLGWVRGRMGVEVR